MARTKLFGNGNTQRAITTTDSKTGKIDNIVTKSKVYLPKSDTENVTIKNKKYVGFSKKKLNSI